MQNFLSKKYTEAKVIITKKNIELENCKNKDDLNTIVELISGNYRDKIENAKKLVDDYISTDEALICESYVKNLIYSFANELSQIHPYFTTYHKDSYNVSIAFSSAQDKSSRIYYFPTNFILVSQIVFEITKKLYDSEEKTKADFHEEVKSHLYPICRSIPPYNMYSQDEILNYFSDNAIEKLKYMEDPLSSIEETLNSFKVCIYYYSLKRKTQQIIDKIQIKNLFITNIIPKRLNDTVSIIHSNIKSKLNDIRILYNNELLEIRFHLAMVNLINENFSKALQGIENIVNQEKYTKILHYKIYSFEQYIFLLLNFVIENDKPIFICNNCNKLFLPSSKKQRYCSRPIPSKPDKTCRDIGSKNKYKKDIVEKTYDTFNKNILAKLNRCKEDKKNELEDRRKDWISKGETTMHKYINEEINKNIAVFELEKAYMNLFDKKDYFPIIYVDTINDTINIDNDPFECLIYTLFAINNDGYVRILDNYVHYDDDKDTTQSKQWNEIKKAINSKSYNDTGLIFANLPDVINRRRKTPFFKADIKPAFLETLYPLLKDITKVKDCKQAYKDIFTSISKETAYKILNDYEKVYGKQNFESWDKTIEKFSSVFECPRILRHAFFNMTQISKFHKMYDEMSKSYTTKESFENALRMISEESIKKEYMIPIHFWQKILNELKNEI